MNDQPQSGELHLAKETSEYTGEAGSFCTITASNIPTIPVGSRIVYASAADETSLDSDITVETGEATATGHLFLDLAGESGTLTLVGGTGALSGIHADAAISYDGTEWHWDGTYSMASAPEGARI
jgi:hypothetical protein